MQSPLDAHSDPRALPPGESGRSLATADAALLANRDLGRIYTLSDSEEVHFWDYWRVLVRRRWTIMAVFLVVVLAAMVHTLTTRPVYISTATLKIDREEPRV